MVLVCQLRISLIAPVRVLYKLQIPTRHTIPTWR